MTPHFVTGRALSIGIAEYQRFRSLPKAVANDASDFAALLCDPNYCGYPEDQVGVLLNKDATKERIVERLRALAAQTKQNDTVIIFFSGHGAHRESASNADNYLIPSDGDPNRLASALKSDEFTSLLKQIEANRLVILLDACHSAGAADVSKKIDKSDLKLGFDDNFYGRLASGTGRVMIASCKTNEVSMVHAGMRNSVFTHCLLQSMKGESHVRADGLIRVLDVFHDLAEKIPVLEPQQHPILKVHDAENNFALALYPTHKAETQPGVLQHAVKAGVWQHLEELAVGLYPRGPTDTQIWQRAGGDLAKLSLEGTGVSAWHDAFTKLQRGGGGEAISFETLLQVMKSDFPKNPALQNLSKAEPKKANEPRSINKLALNVAGRTSHSTIRFVRIVREGGKKGAPLTISEFPITQDEVAALKSNISTAVRRTVGLFSRPEVCQLVADFRTAGLQVRLPTYDEWLLAMAASGQALRAPQHKVPEGASPATDHWVPNEWGIGRPPASICEWINESLDKPAQSATFAPVGCLKVRGGVVSFTSKMKPAQTRLPFHLILTE